MSRAQDEERNRQTPPLQGNTARLGLKRDGNLCAIGVLATQVILKSTLYFCDFIIFMDFLSLMGN